MNPLRTVLRYLFSTSQSHICHPLPPASVFPSGLNAILEIQSYTLAPMSVVLCRPLVISHRCTMPRPPMLASVLPLGANAIYHPFGRYPVISPFCAPFPTSHKNSWLPPALTSVCPSGLKATGPLDCVCPQRAVLCSPLATFHRFTVSRPAVARVFPSGLKARLVILSVSRRFFCSPVTAFQRRTPSSLKAVLASVCPSASKAILEMPEVCVPKKVCPMRVYSCFPVAMSHTRTVLSQAPLARVRPSGLNATVLTV